MPIFPDDLVPKFLQGMNIHTGWFPYIHGICVDNQGKPLVFYVSVNFTLGGPKFSFIIQGRTYAGNFDKSAHSYTNGVLTIGTKPRLEIDYHHPHRIRIDINPSMSIRLEITYRGPPLWYSKSTNPADMVAFTPTSFIGGYDVPCRINGEISSPTKSMSFSGYGDYGNVWLLGSLKWKETKSRWLVFNDSHSYGIAVKSYDARTGSLLASTGRIGTEDGSTLTFDDFEWVDDNLQPPRYVRIRGSIRDLSGMIIGKASIETAQSVSLFVPWMWTQHKMTGSIDARNFEGSAWCETRRPLEASTSACIMIMARSGFLTARMAGLYQRFSPKLTETLRKHETLRSVAGTAFESITGLLRLIP